MEVGHRTFPRGPIVQLGEPQPELRRTLVRLLDHADFRVSDAAAHVIAEFASADDLFGPLWERHEQLRRSDGFAWALMRVAETRRDPVLRSHLEWMLRSSRFRSAGYPECIREAIAGLR